MRFIALNELFIVIALLAIVGGGAFAIPRMLILKCLGE